MFFNEKVIGVEKPARHRPYRVPHAPAIQRRVLPGVAGTRLPAGVALAIMTVIALGLWGLIIFGLRAVILG